MTPHAAAQQAYRDSAVLTAPPERLVVMLYDGAIRFLQQAAAGLRQGDLAAMNNRLQRAEAIIQELRSTLDMSAGEVAERLESIYSFSQRHLLEARFEHDPERIERVSDLLGELRGAWAEICVNQSSARTESTFTTSS
ncbi:MAG: flagellar export chaperone FliS [Thermoleophilaceae bacterium]